jgi:D-beta-D-heptose 7-phosphate kinase/D-beta-D-heptose 1-phosphate adenosyltransferase
MLEHNPTKVFVNGCFDLIHKFHIELLNFAKSHGEVLYVGIDSDERVKKLKGPTRPINNQEDRKFLLENLKAVNKVFIFNTEEELTELVKFIKPDIMVVGSDYQNKEVIGSGHAKQLLFFDRVDGYSTTKIIQSIIDRR